jgi:hypothetical protein
MDKPQTLRIISSQGTSLYLYNVVNYQFISSEEYWMIKKANGNHIFVHKSEVGVIGFDEDLK